MNLIDKLKNIFKKKLKQIGDGHNFYTDYRKHLKIAKNDIERFKSYIRKGIPDADRWKYCLNEKKLSLKFIRPNMQEDINERNRVAENFVNELRDVYSDKLNLRFHGTPIYFAEQIIKSQGIFSSVDINDGYMASTDLSGEISASSIESLNRTMDFFTDIVSYQRGLPCGAVFALKPKDETDGKIGSDILKSVSFKENPEQLYSIISTKENIRNLKKWCEKSGLDSSLVHTFDDFIKVVQKDATNYEKKPWEVDPNILDSADSLTEPIEPTSQENPNIDDIQY